MGFLDRFRKQPEPTASSMHKMIELANEFGGLAVERYREGVAELGFEAGVDGVIKARIIGAAVPTVAHNAQYQLTDWQRSAPGMVGHALSSLTADGTISEDTYLHLETLHGIGQLALTLIHESNAEDLCGFYQAVLLNSCPENHLEQLRQEPESGARFLNIAADFTADALSRWRIACDLQIGQALKE